MSIRVNVAGTRLLIVEVGTYKYEMGEGKKEPVGMDWNWRYWYKLMISKICICMCIHIAHMLSMCVHILCVNMYMYMGVCAYF